MENFQVGDWVVPLFEEEKKVLKVSHVGKSLEVETKYGWEISAFCNYRHATKEEIDALKAQ
ncbi:hypothetical protein [Peribacillus frigoritolerans]|uniref:hypothetical protein n=1 Tax=Peribacillus frigoritolerans TaxID=450367 RepID=UPI002079CE9C|nr:hypothetical protein [Peribacillus frigoritolerans]USK66287.1 hypothetical protein LIT26_06560 [Peribacillus frigoritolerans]